MRFDGTIFIQIASYRDPQLVPTIHDCLLNANHPENLRFAIARQFREEDNFDNLDEFRNDARFKIIDIPWRESKGVCWARNRVQQEYDDEQYTFQIDSHMRFAKGWDTIAIDMIKMLQNKGCRKPLLTAYTSSFNPDNDPAERQLDPWFMEFDRFIPEGAIFFLPATIPDFKTRLEPMRARFYSAHCTFTLGQFSTEVPHDPNYYFHGEEISIAARAYTWGYDLFHPHKIIAWHEYTRKGRPKQWDDSANLVNVNGTTMSANDSCHLRNRKLFGMDNIEQDVDFDNYGFGVERTLEDYELYAGVCFKNRTVHPYTWPQKLEPPTPNWKNNPDLYPTKESYEKDMGRNWCVDIWINGSDVKVPDPSIYDFWYVGAHDENGDEIYREDLPLYRIEEELAKSNCSFFLKFCSDKRPVSWTVWPHRTDTGWCEKIGPTTVKLP